MVDAGAAIGKHSFIFATFINPQSPCVGVDIGSFKSVLAAVKNRGIEIILSDTTGKSTP